MRSIDKKSTASNFRSDAQEAGIGVRGIQNSRNGSTLGVCEDFDRAHDEEIRLRDGVRGIQNSRNRSILGVCEDFGCAYNEEIRPQADFYKIYSRPFAFLNNGL
jgi:hypothetical protein